MSLSIPAEYEAMIREAVASGEFATPEEAVKHALELLTQERQAKKAIPQAPRLSKEERQKRLRLLEEWINTREPAGHFVDDSRESIY